MSTFKSPELHVCGRIKTVADLAKPEPSSFYVKATIAQGDWKPLSGNTKS